MSDLPDDQQPDAGSVPTPDQSPPPAPIEPPQATTPPPPGPPPVVPPRPPKPEPLPGAQPDKVKAIGIMLTVSGGMNALAAVIWLLNVLGVALASFGIGLIFCFVPIILGVSAAFELIAGIKHLQKVPGLKPPTTAAYCQIATIVACNPVAMAAGIVTLVFLKEPDVKAFYDSQ